MSARSLLRERRILGEDRFAETVVWQLPDPSLGSRHCYKYRLAFVIDEVCVLRFDSDAGKGDHKHIGDVEASYSFSTLAALVKDFLDAIEQWRPQ
jgi:hypothetical protein